MFGRRPRGIRINIQKKMPNKKKITATKYDSILIK